MASQKEYTMLFALNASLQSGFQSTFGRAQQSITSLQKEINALSKQQSDISAYEKQQRAVSETEKKLEVLKQQYDNIQREIQETEGYSSSLENKLLSKQQQIDKTSTALQNQTDKLDQMGQALTDAGVDTDHLADESKRLEQEMGRLKDEQEKVAESAQSFGEKSVAAFGAIATAIVSASIVNKLKEIGEAYLDNVKIAGNFEASMSQVAATMGVAKSEVSELGDFAKDMGAKTAFTAVQASEGLNILAMAGLKANEQIAGLPTVLNLAAAGNMEMSESAAYVTGTVKGFRDSMEHASYYADLMAKGATLANTDVRGLGEAFSVSAATAKGYGQQADSLTLALLRLAEQNTTGAEAGRGLMQVMKSIYAPTKEARGALEELGVSAYDETGKVRDLNDVVDDINASLSQYSDEQANALKSTIFSSRSLNAFNMMCASSSERVEELWKGIGEAGGSATQQAKTQLDNMNGELTIMNSAMEGVQITMGELYRDDMRKLYKSGAEILTMINNFIKQNPGLVKGLIAGGAALGTITAGLVGATAVVKGLTAANALLFAGVPGVGQIMAVAAAISAVAGAAMVLWENSDTKKVRDLTTEARGLETAMRDLHGKYEDQMTDNQAVAATAQMYIDRLKELQSAGQMDDAQKKEYHQTLELLVQTMPELADKINLTTDAIEGGIPALEKATEDWSRYAEEQAKQEYMAELRQELVDATKEQYKNELSLTNAKIKEQNAVKKQNEAYNQLLSALGMTEEQFRSYYGTVEDVPWRSVSEEVRQARADYIEYGKQVEEAANDQRVLEKALEESSTAVAAAEQTVQNYTDSLQHAGDNADGLTQEQIDVNNAVEDMNGVLSMAESQLGALAEAYSEAYDAAEKSIRGQYQIWDEVSQTVEVSAGTINDRLAEQTKHWQEYNENLASLRNRTGDIEGLSDVIASFADGSQESINAIAGMASASDEDLAAMVSNYQDLQAAQDETATNIAALATNVDQETQNIANSVEQMVSDMNLQGEAEAAARATVQGYISTAAGMLDDVSRTFSQIRGAALSGLGSGGFSTGKGEGGYAAGTDYATPGLHLVGEKGPELMVMKGGEKVIPNDETSKLLKNASIGGSTFNNNVAVNFNISGNADQNVVNQLREYAEDFKEQVLGVLREAEEDEMRRSYAPA